MAQGDVFVYAVKGTMAGSGLVNTQHVIQTALGPGNTEQADAQLVADRIKDFLRSISSGDVTFTTWSARAVRGGGVVRNPADCSITGGALFEGNLTAPLNGTQPAGSLPPQDVIVITEKTLSAGRSRRGRMFVSGISEINQQAGTIDPAAVAIFQGNANTYLADFAGNETAGPPVGLGDYALVVWSETIASGCKPSALHPHQRVNVQPGDVANAHTRVSSLIVRNIVRSQRRRQLGVGT